MYSLLVGQLALSLSALLQPRSCRRVWNLNAPDRGDDELYNRILWLMLKRDVPPPVTQSQAALHALHSSK